MALLTILKQLALSASLPVVVCAHLFRTDELGAPVYPRVFFYSIILSPDAIEVANDASTISACALDAPWSGRQPKRPPAGSGRRVGELGMLSLERSCVQGSTAEQTRAHHSLAFQMLQVGLMLPVGPNRQIERAFLVADGCPSCRCAEMIRRIEHRSMHA
mmetsp:Transcript_990/g.2871  ORF Transcript_990/g.2871 Transcript_990/m.2871 type:complete len:160 (+) Transcript_990:98-577(+)